MPTVRKRELRNTTAARTPLASVLRERVEAAQKRHEDSLVQQAIEVAIAEGYLERLPNGNFRRTDKP